VNPFIEGNACVFGLQWGDEGKGKIVDYLAESADVVVRYCGGANAGHTVRFGDKKYSTHLLPVGIFRKGILNLIGNGVVLDPEALLAEIDEFTGKGFPVTPENLRISYKTHIVMPYHKLEDGARETLAKGNSIGTTRRGIGPSYADKMHRMSAIRVADLVDDTRLRAKLEAIVADRNKAFEHLYNLPPLNARELLEKYRGYAARIKPYVGDTSSLMIKAWKSGKKVLFEGAHAVLLDVDHGTYPYVTSSSCSALGIYAGAGAPPQICRNFVGIMKAYTTRVGGGPFPTEQDNAIGNYIRERGNEYGTTTRRPRRCGWFDAVAVKYSAELCGVTAVAVMLLDVLTGIDELKICTGYTRNGKPIPFEADMGTLADVQPVYETMPGWKEDISGVRRFEDLPANTQKYVLRLEQLIEAPIKMISVAPDRDATLMR
jgi:adenylosuccinate synthase